MSDKRAVIVTGGSRGIGQAICLALAGPDTHIFYNDIFDTAEETGELVEKAGSNATYIKADVTSEEEVKALVDQVMDQFGRVDVLVNNAGITRDGLLVRMKSADWDAVLSINLKGAFHCLRAVARPMMKQRAGRIINIASVVGVAGNPGQANYVASKAGIIGLTKSAALELANRGITVNAVAPGFIETEMTAALSSKAREAMLDRVPMARPGTPEDVAAGVAFLASDQAAYITGQVIHVNGGMYL